MYKPGAETWRQPYKNLGLEVENRAATAIEEIERGLRRSRYSSFGHRRQRQIGPANSQPCGDCRVAFGSGQAKHSRPTRPFVKASVSETRRRNARITETTVDKFTFRAAKGLFYMAYGVWVEARNLATLLISGLGSRTTFSSITVMSIFVTVKKPLGTGPASGDEISSEIESMKRTLELPC